MSTCSYNAALSTRGVLPAQTGFASSCWVSQGHSQVADVCPGGAVPVELWQGYWALQMHFSEDCFGFGWSTHQCLQPKHSQTLALSAGSRQLRAHWRCSSISQFPEFLGRGFLCWGFVSGLLNCLQTHHGLQSPGFSSSVSVLLERLF